ncbi:VOC family protein [Streptomyces erythrochromogenes]|uniref:VOC family protein n=1 Tax=Streptomyces erythrochromogenes TaxID=285574 RepID=UPI00386BB42C|nr:VOC family protein [Streptomyces erythrochromogenes]
MIGRLHNVVIDCPDPDELAGFYEELLSLSRRADTGSFVVLDDAEGAPVVLLQRVDDFRAPRWTDSARPQQMHIDVMVTNLDTAEAQVLALGATLLDGSDKPIGYRVYQDPVGHPFCLITPEGA